METAAQRSTFLKIVRASIINILGFGLAAIAIIYLSDWLNIPILFKILAVLVTLVTLINVSGLLVFIYYTLKSIPGTMSEKPNDMTFGQIYGYTLAALAIRCLEAVLCVYYIVMVFKAVF